MPARLAGQVLLAHPSLEDANFRRAVVLLHAHDAAEGAFGVILNRPLDRALGAVERRFRDGPLAPVPLYAGGPVQEDRLAFAAWTLGRDGLRDVRFGLDEAEAAAAIVRPDCRLRAYVGHSGWSGGQLERELKLGAWVVAPLGPEAETLVGEDLWRRWLRRAQPELGLTLDAPGDVGLN